jgi:3-hydroxyisobutyrate dehydrogenase-like beta-hydroxyacid dehydrogenase
MSMRVGFVGLGNMGSAMARNLLRAGHQLTLYNRTPARAAELAAAGCTVAAAIGDLAGVEVVVTMLSDDHALEAVALGSAGLLGLPAGLVHISCSTVSVALSRRLTEAHRQAGQTFVAAPVLGRPEAAAAAKLFILAAGPAAAVDTCRPLFDALGQRAFVLGEEPALANTLKLACNFLLAAVIEGLGEAFAFTEKAGLARPQVLEVLTETLFSAPVYKTYGALIAERRFEPAGFKLPLGLKDVRLALAAADSLDVPLPLLSLLHDQMLAALAEGHPDLDWSALAMVAARHAGLRP